MNRRDDTVDSGFVPPALASRVEQALGAAGREAGTATTSSSPTPEDLVAAGETLLGDVLRGAGRDRATALDLLAADALVTRAFELAASEPQWMESLEALARGSMRRIAALVDAG